MKRLYLLVFIPLFAALSGASVTVATTYYKDVLPILQSHCLSCHGANPIAPVAFQTYRQARSWAEAIEQMVASRRMPPSRREEGNWSLKIHGVLTAGEISTITVWVDQGAVAGDPHDAPPNFYSDQANYREGSSHSRVARIRAESAAKGSL